MGENDYLPEKSKADTFPWNEVFGRAFAPWTFFSYASLCVGGNASVAQRTECLGLSGGGTIFQHICETSSSAWLAKATPKSTHY